MGKSSGPKHTSTENDPESLSSRSSVRVEVSGGGETKKAPIKLLEPSGICS